MGLRTVLLALSATVLLVARLVALVSYFLALRLMDFGFL